MGAKIGCLPAATDDILKRLHELDAELAADMAEQWRRDLPFEEVVFDRWERARRLGFGEGASIYRNSYVFQDVAVGANTWIGPFVMLDGVGGLSIGDYCSISTGVQVYTHDTVRWALTGGHADREAAPVSIGDCTYIGAGTTVLKGVDIGDHCVVGANCLVTRSIPPYSIALGSPATVRGNVVISDDHTVELALDGSAG